MNTALPVLLVLIAQVAGEDRAYVTIPEQDRAALIVFSHQNHLVNSGLVCADCHTEAHASQSSEDNVLPKEETCGRCHAEVSDPFQCAFCHQQGAPRVAFDSPERIIDFPHQFHVGQEQMNCEDCHAGLDQTDYASRLNWPIMTDCLTCHQDVDAPYECETCHPKVEAIRPRTHRVDWLHEHPQHVRATDMPCSVCHTDGWCEDCHAGALLATTSAPADRVAIYAPSLRGRVAQVIERQHEPNYRFTHPLDSVGKERTCQTCHEPDYCMECHRVEGREDRFKPVWHGTLPNDPVPWVLSGVGTGGGRHGQWARRDLERCLACHDVDGADPSCLQCHVDFDGVRGTDPATHPAGFADDVGKGGFHGDDHATCYACHLNVQTTGVGFCGYCHP